MVDNTGIVKEEDIIDLQIKKFNQRGKLKKRSLLNNG